MRKILPINLSQKKISYDDRHPQDWRFGAYQVSGPSGRSLGIISSADYGWEHVSVGLVGERSKTPNWDEMCFVKSLFWDDEECVMQFHPPKSVYINLHPGVLHLWKPTGKNIETPPRWMIGPYEGWEKDVPKELSY